MADIDSTTLSASSLALIRRYKHNLGNC